jgi:hypothetical protein
MKKRQAWIAAGFGAALGIFAAQVSVVAAGGGHGSYFPAVVFFPFTMLSVLVTESISIPAMVLALAQFPCYGLAIGSAMAGRHARLGAVLAAVHGAAVLLALATLRGGDFL